MGEAKAEVRGSGVPAGSIATRTAMGEQSIERVAETASVAVAAQAKAAIHARYELALLRPRDWDTVRDHLLKECRRPGFAEVARFAKPIGKQKNNEGKWEDKFVEGFSIRFAEAAIRCAGNVLVEEMAIYDDPTKRIVRVTVTDLESNATYPKDIVIEKSVERSKPREGQEVLSTRTNSYGKQTFLVRATEDDLLNKQGALVSKTIRGNALRLIPGDLLDDCEQMVGETLAKKDAADPNAARKKLADAFSAMGVKPADLKGYLGHDLEGCSPAELLHLRQVYQAIKDGETTWRDVLGTKEQAPEAKAAPSTVSEAIAAKAGKKPGPQEAPDGTLLGPDGKPV